MKLNKVTITGADESVTADDLIKLSKEYPFVQWGILYSETNQGIKPRYPNYHWIFELLDKTEDKKLNVNLASHLCGEYAKKVLSGEFPSHIWPLVEFDTIQINAQYSDLKTSRASFWLFLNRSFQDKEFIFQLRNVVENDILFYATSAFFEDKPTKISGLVDNSGGSGKIINSFPKYEGYKNIGYAGGINPDNIQEVIENILLLPGDESFWIDMESGVRTDDKFDLDKVESCLKQAKKYI